MRYLALGCMASCSSFALLWRSRGVSQPWQIGSSWMEEKQAFRWGYGCVVGAEEDGGPNPRASFVYPVGLVL